MRLLVADILSLLSLISCTLAAAVPRASAGCSFVCPPSDRSNHALANTMRKSSLMECYYSSSGTCAYSLNAGKLKPAKSTNNNCRPNAIASCSRKRTKTKTSKKKQAQAQAQVQPQAAALLIQRATTPTPTNDDESAHVGRGHDDM